jgi:hypothetical protein
MDSTEDNTATYKILRPAEVETLEAIADRIFPKTDTPGAIEIGAVHYIDVALAGDYAPLLPLYSQGLRSIDRHARRKFAARFAELSDPQKDQVLAEFEAEACRFLERRASSSKWCAIMCWKESSASRNTAATET